MYMFLAWLTSSLPFIIYIIFHIFIWLGSKYVLNRSETINELEFLQLFLPGVGGIIIFVIEVSKKYIKPRTKNIDKITIYELIHEDKKFTFLGEDKVLPYIDNMKYLNSDDQLSLLFDVLENTEYDKLKILKQAIDNNNQIVKYYSSLYLSTLSNRYESTIFEVLDKYEKTSSLNNLKRLINLYDSYLNSGLIKGYIYNFYNDSYKSLLQYAIESNIGVLENSKRLIKAFLESSEYQKAYSILEKYKDNYSDDLEYRLIEINYYIETNNFNMIEECVKKTSNDFIGIPQKESTILEFWRKAS